MAGLAPEPGKGAQRVAIETNAQENAPLQCVGSIPIPGAPRTLAGAAQVRTGVARPLHTCSKGRQARSGGPGFPGRLVSSQPGGAAPGNVGGAQDWSMGGRVHTVHPEEGWEARKIEDPALSLPVALDQISFANVQQAHLSRTRGFAPIISTVCNNPAR